MASLAPVHNVVSLYSVSGCLSKKSLLQEQMATDSTNMMSDLFFIIIFIELYD